MFDHVELRDENEAKLAAGASLAKLVLLAREVEEERKKKQNVPPQPDPDNTDGEGGEGGDTPPEPAGYVVSEKLKALLKEAEELE